MYAKLQLHIKKHTVPCYCAANGADMDEINKEARDIGRLIMFQLNPAVEQVSEGGGVHPLLYSPPHHPSFLAGSFKNM
jgi:hypothetical protein